MTIDFRSEFLFSACLLYRAVHNGQPSERDIWEESIILLYANSETLAMERAANIGDTRQVTYAVKDGDIVCLQFISVERVFKIEDALTSEGVEVFSRHVRGAEIRSLLEPFADE